MSLPESKIPYKRLFIESLAIVSSILLAFAIDAWWDRQQESAEERVVLESLLADFRFLEGQFKWLVPYTQGIRDASSELYEISGLPDSETDQEHVTDLLAITMWHTGGQGWVTPAIDSLTYGGDLKIIDNPEIRLDVARWVGMMRVTRNLELADHRFYEEFYRPYLSRHANMHQIYYVQEDPPGNAPPEMSESPLGYVEIKPKNTMDHRILLKDQEFLNLLSVRWGNIWDINNVGFYPMMVAIEPTIALLEREIAKYD